jgi:hypothetical protein
MSRIQAELVEHGVTLHSVLSEQKKTNGRVTDLESAAVLARIELAAERARAEERRKIRHQEKEAKEAKVKSWQWWTGVWIGVVSAIAAFGGLVILIWETFFPSVHP